VFLNSDILEQLISGTFPVNISHFYDVIAYADEDESDVLPESWVDFSEVLRDETTLGRVIASRKHVFVKELPELKKIKPINF
jgi:hypothetical protein